MKYAVPEIIGDKEIRFSLLKDTLSSLSKLLFFDIFVDYDSFEEIHRKSFLRGR